MTEAEKLAGKGVAAVIYFQDAPAAGPGTPALPSWELSVPQRYGYYTGKVGELCRPLALGGIAALWLFRIGEREVNLDPKLMYALMCFVLSLALDVAQYLFGTICWGYYFYRNTSDDTVSKHPVLNLMLGAFVMAKALAMLIGYGYLVSFLTFTINNPVVDLPSIQTPRQ